MGYRRIRDELDGHKGIHVNDKRVLRICRKYDIKSNIKWKPKSCTRGDRNPDHIAKNYLHREFHAEKPNEKWLTDVCGPLFLFSIPKIIPEIKNVSGFRIRNPLTYSMSQSVYFTALRCFHAYLCRLGHSLFCSSPSLRDFLS